MRLIDAEELFNKVGKIVPRNTTHYKAIGEFMNMITNSLTIEPKRGEWIKISPAGIYECSLCGKTVMTGDIEAYDFCHGCGARMKGVSDEYHCQFTDNGKKERNER